MNTSVLLVEDDSAYAVLVQDWLRGHADFDTVATISDARDKLRTYSYDLIVVDRKLPDGDGEYLIKQLRADGCESTIVVLSAFGDQHERIRILKAGADDYLSKELGPIELSARILSHLDRHLRHWSSAHHLIAALTGGEAVTAAVHDDIAFLPAADGNEVAAAPIDGAGSVAMAAVSFDPQVTDRRLVAAAVNDLAHRVASSSGVTAEQLCATIQAEGITTAMHPIVDVSTGLTVGFEALARLADGTPPERWFNAARNHGLQVDAELAAIAAHARALKACPVEGFQWVSINVGPKTLMDPRIADVWPTGVTTIVELTEHERVLDYERLAAVVASLPGSPALAIDDAGAGYSCLSHVLALRPDYVKIDRTWTAGLNDDPARQALVVGMLHFAGEIGATLIVEGVENASQLAMAERLGVPLVQGHLYGVATPVTLNGRPVPNE